IPFRIGACSALSKWRPGSEYRLIVADPGYGDRAIKDIPKQGYASTVGDLWTPARSLLGIPPRDESRHGFGTSKIATTDPVRPDIEFGLSYYGGLHSGRCPGRDRRTEQRRRGELTHGRRENHRDRPGHHQIR